MAIETLASSQLRLSTDDSVFKVSCSDELSPASPCLGQGRAVAALQTALAIPGPGYHVMVIGKEGTGRLNCLNSLLQNLDSVTATTDTQTVCCYLSETESASIRSCSCKMAMPGR